MQQVSRQEKLLSGPEIIASVLEGQDPKYLAYIASLAAAPNTEIVQSGNTAFISTRAEGKHQDKMKGTMYSIDTATNLPKNITDYLAHIQKIGVRYYEVRFSDPNYENAFRKVYNQLKPKGVGINVGDNGKTQYIALVALTDAPIKNKGKKA
jgi:dihydroorotate dehydrogenase